MWSAPLHGWGPKPAKPVAQRFAENIGNGLASSRRIVGTASAIPPAIKTSAKIAGLALPTWFRDREYHADQDEVDLRVTVSCSVNWKNAITNPAKRVTVDIEESCLGVDRQGVFKSRKAV